MFRHDVKLSLYSNYKIGGIARYFCEPASADEIIAALKEWRKIKRKKRDIFILGGGTNLLINDGGFDGLVIKPAVGHISADETKIRVGAGVLMRELVDFAAIHGLAGLEWAGGLPGTVGGAIRGNAGAFGGETKDAVFEVASLNIAKKEPRLMNRMANECAFGYRNSIFKINDGEEIILEATLQMKTGDPAVIARTVAEKIRYREERHPMDYPNIGSIFKNVPVTQIYAERTRNYAEALRKSAFSLRGSAIPVKNDPFPVVPAAYLIAASGVKGVSYGGAMISPKHPNFIVNVLDASASDVKSLIKLVKSQVKKKFGIVLEEEVIYV
ncbi:MAG: UDP-N-acetylmuramate dehydrogenase [bacterium]|nr:UDP-N-acetylmuramate dehydrogenase [bacterium]